MTGAPVTLHTRSGIEVALDDVSVRALDGGTIELEATASAEVWATIEGALLFNLDAALDAEGQLPPMLPAGQPVTFAARLDAGLAEVLPMVDDHELEAALRAAPLGDPLADTESWFLAEAKAGGGEGYVTAFAADGAALAKPARAAMTIEVGDERPAEPPGRLLALALSFLRATDIDVEVLGTTAAGGIHHGVNGDIDLVVISREEAEQLLAYARCHDPVPEARRGAVMELITRINPQLPGTWFELELDTGRMSCRATLNARGCDVTDDTFAENVIWLALRTMDEHQPALRAVAFEGIEVADIEAAEDALDAEG